MIKEKLNKVKENKKMTNLETLMLDVTNTLNHNGFNDVRITPQGGEDFSIRVGYWDRIEPSLIETMEEYHSVRIIEDLIEDEDCGELYYYFVEPVDEDTGYTLNELNELESNYSKEALYLESVGADDTWGNA
jgi:hypothetical protein